MAPPPLPVVPATHAAVTPTGIPFGPNMTQVVGAPVGSTKLEPEARYGPVPVSLGARTPPAKVAPQLTPGCAVTTVCPFPATIRQFCPAVPGRPSSSVRMGTGTPLPRSAAFNMSFWKNTIWLSPVRIAFSRASVKASATERAAALSLWLAIHCCVWGTASAARIPIMVMTMASSIIVKPAWLFARFTIEASRAWSLSKRHATGSFSDKWADSLRMTRIRPARRAVLGPHFLAYYEVVCGVCGRRGGRQPEHEARAAHVQRLLEFEYAALLFRKAECICEPETRPFPWRLRGEERIEDAFAVFGGDTRSVIGHHTFNCVLAAS